LVQAPKTEVVATVLPIFRNDRLSMFLFIVVPPNKDYIL